MRSGVSEYVRFNRRDGLSEVGNWALTVAAAFFIVAVPHAFSGAVYWDGSGTGWDAVGSWSTASGATTPDPLVAPGSGDDVVFNITSVNTAQTINLNGNQFANSITNSTTGAVTLLGGGTDRTLTLGLGGFARTGNAATTIGSPTAGQRVNVILGADQTWLNTIAGSDTTISNGVAAFSPGDNTTTNVLTLNAANKGFFFAGNNNTTTALSDGAAGRRLALVKNGSGAVTLGSTNTYGGGTTLNAGTIVLNATNALGTGPIVLAGGTLQHNVGTTLTNDIIAQAGTTSSIQGNAANGLTLTGNITGSGNLSSSASVNFSGPQLAGNNSGFSGVFTVNNNSQQRFKLASTNAGSPNASWVFYPSFNDGIGLTCGNGTIKLGAMSGNANIRNDSGSTTTTLEIGALNTNSTFTGLIQDNGANNIAIRKVGSGALVLTGANTYDAGTLINGGTLVFSNATAFGSGNITFGGGTLKHGITFTNDVSAKIASSTGAIAIDDAGQTVIYATSLASSNTGGLTKKGAGTLTLNSQPAYTGATTVEAGTLSVGTSFGSASAVTVSNNATMGVGGALTCANITLGNSATLSAVGSITGGVVTAGTGASIKIAKSAGWPLSGTFEIMSFTAAGSSALSDANVSVSGISGNSVATLDFATAGKVYLTISSEKLVWNGGEGDDWRGTGKWIGQNSGSTYTFTDYDSVVFTNAANAGTSTVAIATSDVTPTSANFDVGAGYGYKLVGPYGIAGAGSTLTKNGSGTVIFANANSYAGATTVNAGELALGDGTAIGALGAATPITVADGAAFTVNNGSSQTVANAFSGAGFLKKKGAGKLVLSGQTTFTGRIAAEEGTLCFNPSANFMLSSVITNSGAIEQAAKAIIVTNSAMVSGASGTWTVLPGAELNFPGDFGGINYFGGLSELRLAGGKTGTSDYGFNVTLSPNLRAVDGTSNTIDGIEANFSVSGKLLGSGTINSYSSKRGIMLWGDNSGFSGTFAFQTGGGPYTTCGFFTTNSCGSNAVWNINYNTATDRAGAIHSLRFDVGGTYRLGALNTVAGSQLYCRDGTDGTPSVYDTVLEIGRRNTDCAIEGGFVKNRFTLTKVGAAKLTLGGGFNCPVGTSVGVYGGTLAVNCTLSNATVTAASGTRIEGVGAITNVFAWGNGVTVSAGTNGVGTLTLATTPVVSSGAVFAANVSSNSTCAVLSVQGNLDISALTLQVADVNQLNAAYSYMVATTTGSVNGRFASKNLPAGWVARNEGADIRILKTASGTVLSVK